MEAVAKLRNCPMSARKMRLVVNNIRGQEVDKALNILKFTRKEAATWLEKLVLSAVANWEVKAGEGVDADEYELFIKTAFVDEGPMLKRFRPAPFGRAHRIRKHTNHVTIIVENAVPLEELEDEDYDDEGFEDAEVEEVVEAAVVADDATDIDNEEDNKE